MGAPLSLFSDAVGDVRLRRRILSTSLGHLCCQEAPPTSAVTHIIGELQERCQAIKGLQQASALQGYPVPSATAAAAWARVRLRLTLINQHECRRPDTAQQEEKKNQMWTQTSATHVPKLQVKLLSRCKKHHLLPVCAIGPCQRSIFHFEPRSQIINLLRQKGTLKSFGFISHVHLEGKKHDR